MGYSGERLVLILSGLLEPIWENISKDSPKGIILKGQRISVPGNYLKIFVAVDSKKQAHFLISPAPDEIQKLSHFSFRGLSFEMKECEISGYKSNKYLDLVCSVFDAGGRRPFAKFCEDVLVELGKEKNVEDAVHKTCVRWKRFWEAPYEDSFSENWLKGLFGELVFINNCLKKQNKESVISAWCGPDKDNYDFQANNIAVEVKTTVTVPAVIQVNNINQMDSTLFKNLWIVVIMVSSSNQVENIVSMVNKIEKTLHSNSDIVDIFWDKLCKAGYRRYLENSYTSYGYLVNDIQWFEVNKDFPKIIPSSFKSSIDKRIKSLVYTIELSGIEPIKDQKRIEKSMGMMYQI